MRERIRYQGAIVRDHRILLIKQHESVPERSYWVIPGGARELAETEEECLRREMMEETHLRVTVERLLLDEEGEPGGIYTRLKTYLCRADTGQAQPGYEPEVDPELYQITEVGWFDLCSSAGWGAELTDDDITFPLLQRIQAALGYPVAPAP